MDNRQRPSAAELDEMIARIRKKNAEIKLRSEMIDKEIQDAKSRNTCVRPPSDEDDDNVPDTMYSDQVAHHQASNMQDPKVSNINNGLNQGSKFDNEAWRIERSQIDRERILRQKLANGWRREWDADKSLTYDMDNDQSNLRVNDSLEGQFRRERQYRSHHRNHHITDNRYSSPGITFENENSDTFAKGKPNNVGASSVRKLVTYENWDENNECQSDRDTRRHNDEKKKLTGRSLEDSSQETFNKSSHFKEVNVGYQQGNRNFIHNNGAPIRYREKYQKSTPETDSNNNIPSMLVKRVSTTGNSNDVIKNQKSSSLNGDNAQKVSYSASRMNHSATSATGDGVNIGQQYTDQRKTSSDGKSAATRLNLLRSRTTKLATMPPIIPSQSSASKSPVAIPISLGGISNHNSSSAAAIFTGSKDEKKFSPESTTKCVTKSASSAINFISDSYDDLKKIVIKVNSQSGVFNQGARSRSVQIIGNDNVDTCPLKKIDASPTRNPGPVHINTEEISSAESSSQKVMHPKAQKPAFSFSGFSNLYPETSTDKIVTRIKEDVVVEDDQDDDWEDDSAEEEVCGFA